MRRISVVTLAAAVLIGCLLTQSVPVGAQEDPALAEAGRKTEAFVAAMIDFTKDVRLDEASLRTVLDNMPSLNAIKDDEEGDALSEKAFRNGRYDVSVVLEDPEYVSWARGRGLDPKGFFKDMMRLVSLTMRSEIQSSAERMHAQLPETRKQIEAMRAQMGEAAYKQAMESMKTSSAMLERMSEMVNRLPAPSASETALLEQYQDRIRQAMQADDEDPMAPEGMGPEGSE